MKIGSLFLCATVISLLGCTVTQQSVKPEINAAMPKHGDDKNSICKAQVSPSISCSDTVTAVFDNKGALWVAWVSQDRIYVQSSADKGQTFSEAVVVNSTPEPIIAHDEYRPKIRLDGQGNLFLTWTRSLEKHHTGHIRFSRSIDGGNSFSQPVTVNDNQDLIGHRFDSLALGKNGEVFIAWLDARDKESAKAKNQDFAGTSLYYTWSDNAGKDFHADKLVAAHTCECCRLGVSIDTDNLPVVLWRGVLDGNVRDHELVKFTDWHTPGTVQRASKDNWKIEACPHHGPGLSIADNGVYHQVWFSGGGDRQGLFYANSADAGLNFSPAYQFGDQTAKHPNVFSLGQQVAIAWLEFDGNNNLLQLIKSNDGGKTWSDKQQIGKTEGKADYGFVLSDGKQLYLSWQTRQGYQFMTLDD